MAYQAKKKYGPHMCHGGDCDHPSHKMAEGGDAPKPKLMAEGGEMTKRDRAMAAFIGSYQPEDKPEIDGGNAHPMAEENVSHPESHDSSVSHEVENQEGDEDEGAGGGNEVHPMVLKIVMGRAKGYSKGGVVANEHEESTDEQLNEFDDLPKDDHLEAHQDGSEEHGDEEEDEDREEVVKKVLSSRSKKDRMPRPA